MLCILFQHGFNYLPNLLALSTKPLNQLDRRDLGDQNECSLLIWALSTTFYTVPKPVTVSCMQSVLHLQGEPDRHRRAHQRHAADPEHSRGQAAEDRKSPGRQQGRKDRHRRCHQSTLNITSFTQHAVENCSCPILILTHYSHKLFGMLLGFYVTDPHQLWAYVEGSYIWFSLFFFFFFPKEIKSFLSICFHRIYSDTQWCAHFCYLTNVLIAELMFCLTLKTFSSLILS